MNTIEQKAPGDNLRGLFVCSVFLGCLLSFTRNIMPGFHVAFTTVCLVEFIADINRMYEIGDAFAKRDILLGLVKDIVADLAVF